MTLEERINNASPQEVPNLLHLSKLGTMLKDLFTEVSETGTIPADTAYYFDLDRTPQPGTLRVSSGATVLSEYVGASAVAAGQFKLSGKRVTVHSGQASATYVAQYLPGDLLGADATYTTKAAILAQTYPNITR